MPADSPTPPHAKPDAAPALAAEHVYGQGKRKLLEAATRLSARLGHSQFSLRELAREAGLSHNSLYRHFQSVDEMMPALVEAFCQELREGLTRTRRSVPAGQSPSRAVTGWLLDFALAHADAFTVAMRQRHGPPSAARGAIEQALHGIREDMRVQLTALGVVPSPPPPRMDWALQLMVEQSFLLCLECIEHPGRREDLIDRGELSFTWIVGGALKGGAQSK